MPRDILTLKFFCGYDFLPESTTPLHLAAKDGHLETVSQLLSQGADVNQSSTDRGLTPLHLASALSSLEMVKMLVDAGADVNFRDKDEGTPLMIACYIGLETISRYLMEKGSEVNARCRYGRTPLVYTIGSNSFGVSFFSDLLRAGACVNNRDVYGMTPLHAAIIRRNSHPYDSRLDILQLLLSYPCDIDAANILGYTVLNFAAHLNDLEAAMMLIRAGYKVNVEDNSAFTPVYHAIRNENHNLLEIFLAAGARVSCNILLKVKEWVSEDPTKWGHALALCGECPRLSIMCRRAFYDHYGTQTRNRIDELPLSPLIKRFLFYEIL